jgi:hypothetical protein
MPLTNDDIEVLSLLNRQVKNAHGQFIAAKEIRIRVRGQNEEVIYVPLDGYTKQIAEQAILRAAADIVDLLEQFPVRG